MKCRSVKPKPFSERRKNKERGPIGDVLSGFQSSS